MVKLQALHDKFCTDFMDMLKKLKNSLILQETADTFYFGNVCVSDRTESVEDSVKSKPPYIKQKSKK